MAIDKETKSRLLSFKEKLLVVDVLKADAKQTPEGSSVIDVETIAAYVGTVAHKLGKDSTAVSPSTVQNIARELGIDIRPSRVNMSLPLAINRIIALEQTVQTMQMQLVEANRLYDTLNERIIELERAYTDTPQQVPVPERPAEPLVRDKTKRAYAP